MAQAQEAKGTPLANTGFGLHDDDIEFFGIKSGDSGSQTSRVIDEVLDDDDDFEDDEDINLKDQPKPSVDKNNKNTPQPKDEEDEEDEEEDDPVFFGQGQKDKAKEDGKNAKADDEGVEEKDEQFYSTLTKELKERGVFTIDIEDEEEVDEEKFFELQEQEIEARIDETFKGFFEEMDDEGKAFLQFKRKGGKTSDFVRVFGQPTLPDNLDMEKESDQIKVVKHHLATIEKLDDSDIEDRIEWLKEGNKLGKYAAKYYENGKEADKARKEQLLKNQEDRVKADEKSRNEFVSGITQLITTSDEINKVTLTKVDKKELPDYMTKAVVKEKNQYFTGFQADLKKVMNDPNKLVILAKILKSDFDFTQFKEEATTKQTRTIKSKLQQTKIGGKQIKSNATMSGRSIADFFPDEE